MIVLMPRGNPDARCLLQEQFQNVKEPSLGTIGHVHHNSYLTSLENTPA